MEVLLSSRFDGPYILQSDHICHKVACIYGSYSFFASVLCLFAASSAPKCKRSTSLYLSRCTAEVSFYLNLRSLLLFSSSPQSSLSDFVKAYLSRVPESGNHPQPTVNLSSNSNLSGLVKLFVDGSRLKRPTSIKTWPEAR